MGNIGTWQLIIVLAIVLLLFGAKRLPDAARGLGRSLKIFKTETQGLINDDKKNDDEPTTPPNQQPRAVEATPPPADQPAAPAAPPSTSAVPPSTSAAEPANDQTRRDG